MEQDSTQAVKADTTAQEPVVKRLRRGEVKEDGMVFWAYTKTKELWYPRSVFDKKRAQVNAWAANNREKVRATGKAWRAANKERKREAGRRRYREARERCLAVSRAWFAKNPEYKRIYERERRAKDPLHAMRSRLRGRVAHAFKARGFRKSTKTEAMLGCTYAEFKAHIEAQFLPGMSWENRHLWHIDHYVPCAVAASQEETEALFHYTNLRPLWGPDNLAKNATLPEEHELPANLHPKVKEIWLTAQAR